MLPQGEGTSKQASHRGGAALWANTGAGHTWPHVQLNAHACAHIAPKVPGTRRDQQQGFILWLPLMLKPW